MLYVWWRVLEAGENWLLGSSSSVDVDTPGHSRDNQQVTNPADIIKRRKRFY
jgi:hypothetical protein